MSALPTWRAVRSREEGISPSWCRSSYRRMATRFNRFLERGGIGDSRKRLCEHSLRRPPPCTIRRTSSLDSVHNVPWTDTNIDRQRGANSRGDLTRSTNLNRPLRSYRRGLARSLRSVAEQRIAVRGSVKRLVSWFAD